MTDQCWEAGFLAVNPLKLCCIITKQNYLGNDDHNLCVDLENLAILFSQVYPLKFFLIFDHLWWFWFWGFGVWVLVWVFGVGVFSCWGLRPVVWGLLGFWGWGSLYKHKRITLGKKWWENLLYKLQNHVSGFWLQSNITVNTVIFVNLMFTV